MSNQPTTRKASTAVIDAIVGGYLVAILLRIVVPAIVGYTAPAAGMFDAVAIGLGMLVFTMLNLFTGASVGYLFLSGKLPENETGKRLTQHLGWFTLLCSIVAGWVITAISPLEFFSSDGLGGAGRIFKALATPNFDIIGEALAAMTETIFTAFMATMVAVPISFVLAFPSARNVMNRSPFEKTLYATLRAILNVTRSMEPIIWAIIFSVWVGIGPFAGMLALVVHTIASLTKQYSEQIEGIEDGPVEAIEATGASRIQVLWFAVVPQCVIPFLSFTIYRWDINVRMATIIGFVGGGGIGTLLTQYQGLSKFNEVGTLMIVITMVVWLMDVASARVREVLK